MKLRDIQSYTFEVQTVGRILRMPQQKHYEDETLRLLRYPIRYPTFGSLILPYNPTTTYR